MMFIAIWLQQYTIKDKDASELHEKNIERIYIDECIWMVLDMNKGFIQKWEKNLQSNSQYSAFMPHQA